VVQKEAQWAQKTLQGPSETKRKQGEKKAPQKTLKKTCLSKGTGSAFKGRALQRHVLKFCIRCSKQREQSKKGGPIESSGLRPRLAARPRPRLRRWKQRNQKRLKPSTNHIKYLPNHPQKPQTKPSRNHNVIKYSSNHPQ